MTNDFNADPDLLTKLDTANKKGIHKPKNTLPIAKGAMVYLPESSDEGDSQEQELVLLRILLGDMAMHFRHGIFEALQDIEARGAYPPEVLTAIRPTLFHEIDRFVELCESKKLKAIALRFREQFARIYDVFESSEKPLQDEGAFSVLSEMIEILDPDQVFIPGSVQPIGRGGFGVVYRGRLKFTGEEVAIKLIRDQGGRATMRAKEEGLGLMQSQHIVGVLKAHLMFRARTDIAGIKNSAGHIVLLTELINGPSLRALLMATEDKSFPVQQDMLRFLSDVCETMAQVHAQGILHRDLKPSNIMIGEDGTIRVIDFGLIKRNNSDMYPVELQSQSHGAIGSQSGSFESFGKSKPGEDPFLFETRERTNGALGTVYYMSPEHLDSKCSEGSDTWPIFLMILEVLLGEVVWEGLDRSQIINMLASHRAGKADLIDALKRRFDQQGRKFAESPLLEELLRSGLQRDPNRRPSMLETSQLIRLNRVVRDPDSENRLELMDEYVDWRSKQLQEFPPTRIQVDLDDSERQIVVHQTFIRQSLEMAEQMMSEGGLHILRNLARNVDRMLLVKTDRPLTLSERHRRKLSYS